MFNFISNYLVVLVVIHGKSIHTQVEKRYFILNACKHTCVAHVCMYPVRTVCLP